MAQMMDARSVFGSSAAAPSGRLPALLAAAAFLLAAVTGNSFALHVGMTSSPPEAAVAVDSISDAAAGTVAVLDAGVGDVLPDTPVLMPVGSDAQHLMHLLGACLAVLAAAALCLRLCALVRALLGGHPAVTALPRLVAPRPTGSWCPPPPCPPTSSPVIRT